MVPKPIDPAQTIFRLDIGDVEWSAVTWDRILAENPYGVTYETTNATTCYQHCGTQQPFVRGDWFVARASIPPLYHDILDLPKTDLELEKKLLVDVLRNRQTDRVARAGFNGSGVSNNNRLIERHRSNLTRGAYWKSTDFGSNDGTKNLFKNPADKDGKDTFAGDGGEIIFNLPNGLQGYMLIDAKGERIDKGPISVVSDPKRPDKLVVNGLSCMSCHAKGMIEKDDQVRDAVLDNPNGYTADVIAVVKALYPEKPDFDALVAQDKDRFSKAVAALGIELGETEPIVTLALRFEELLDLPLAAAEAGVSSEEFVQGLGRSPELASIFGTLKVPGGTVQREVYLANFGLIVRDLKLGTYVGKSLSSDDPDYMRALALHEGFRVQMDKPEAQRLFRQAAERGHTLAMTFLGDIYINGDGVPEDKDEGTKWYRKAMPELQRLADRGDPVAQVQYGFMFDVGIGIEVNKKMALEWYQKSANQGHWLGQANVAFAYADGKGVPQDYVKANDWYRKAAAQDYAQAQKALGNAYREGLGVAKNDEDALQWYRKAAVQGDAFAQFWLGSMYAGKNNEEAVQWVRKAADQNFALAQNELGNAYSGGFGVAKNDEVAMQWFRKAADQKLARAQFNVGLGYWLGHGVANDDEEAVHWFRKAAEQQFALSFGGLGLAYLEGRGVRRDREQAAFWLRKAARSDDAQVVKDARDLMKQNLISE